MKKKGFIGDYLIYIIMLFILSIALLTTFYVVTTVNDAWQGTPNLPTESTRIMSRFTARFASVWDNFYLFMVIGFAIVTIILAFAIRSHPVFAGLTIFFLIFLGIIAVFFANAYYDIASITPFAELTDDFSMMNWLAKRLPHIVVIFGVIFIIILFAKTKNQGLQI